MLPQEIQAEVDLPGAVNSGVALTEGFWAAGLGGLSHMQMPETHSPACRGYLASVAPAKRFQIYSFLVACITGSNQSLHSMHTLLCV